MTRLLASILSLVLTATSAAADDDYMQIGEWQTIFLPEGCSAWTVTLDGPNAQLIFRALPDSPDLIDLRGAGWTNDSAPFVRNADGFAEVTISVPGRQQVFSLLPIDHSASLSETYDPEGFSAVHAFVDAAALAGEVMTVSSAAGVIGHFSTDGYVEIKRRYDICRGALAS